MTKPDVLSPPDREGIRQLFADHSVALEFVREIASIPCDDADCGHCLSCRAAKWLNTPLLALSLDQPREDEQQQEDTRVDGEC